MKMMKDVEYSLIVNSEQFDEMLKEIEPYMYISFDTENNGLNPTTAIPAGFSIAVNENKGYYIAINHADVKTDLWKRFGEVLKNKELIIMHNAPYDAGIVEAQYKLPQIRKFDWTDTMVAAHLLDERRGKCGLKFLSKVHLGYKQATFNETVGDLMPTEVSVETIYKYAIDDAICTFKLYNLFNEQMKEQGLDKLFYDIEMPFQKVLLEMKLNGFCFDSKLNKEIEDKLEEDKKDLIKQMAELVPSLSTQRDIYMNPVCTFKFGSANELSVLLYKKLGLPILKRTDKGSPSTDLKTLKTMKDEEGEWLHPIIPPLMKYKEIEQLISSFTHSIREKEVNGKIYGDLLDHGTVTGRLSSCTPNLQNLPKNDTYRIRHCFTASPGYKMVAIDFSQVEYRLAGVVAKSEQFKDLFCNGEDIHLSVANIAFELGLPKEELNVNHPMYSEHCKIYKKQRFEAKSINFGTIFGAGALGLSNLIRCSVEDAKKVLDDYFTRFPEMKRAMKACHMIVDKRGYVKNFYGRRRRFQKEFNGTYHHKCYRDSFNFIIQGLAADILRVVMNSLYDYSMTTDREVKIISTVHDEVIFEVKDNERLQTHIDKLVNIMENTVQTNIPLKVDYDIGDNYGEAK